MAKGDKIFKRIDDNFRNDFLGRSEDICHNAKLISSLRQSAKSRSITYKEYKKWCDRNKVKERDATRLVTIGKNKILCSHSSSCPDSLGTLETLAKIKEDRLQKYFDNNKIDKKTTRKEASILLEGMRPERQKPIASTLVQKSTSPYIDIRIKKGTLDEKAMDRFEKQLSTLVKKFNFIKTTDKGYRLRVARELAKGKLEDKPLTKKEIATLKKSMKKWSRSKAETFKNTDFSKWKFD